MCVRDALVALTLGVSVVVLPLAHATAGTITVTYALTGGNIDLSAPVAHVSPTFGKAKLALKAYRSYTPMGLLASYGYIKGGSILSLSLTGYDKAAGASQTWTVGLGKVGKGIPVPHSLYGSFFGVTPAGSAFTPMGFFFASGPAYGSIYVTHGKYGSFYIPGSGAAGVFGSALSGYAYGWCWNGSGTPGACTAFTYKAPYSVSVPVIGPGFHVAGAEVARIVAVPEPSKNLMLVLGLGLLSLVSVASGRRSRR